MRKVDGGRTIAGLDTLSRWVTRGRSRSAVDPVGTSSVGSPDLGGTEEVGNLCPIVHRKTEGGRPDYKFVRVGPDWHDVTTQSGRQFEPRERTAVRGKVIGLAKVLPERKKYDAAETEGGDVTLRIPVALGPRTNNRPRRKRRRHINVRHPNLRSRWRDRIVLVDVYPSQARLRRVPRYASPAQRQLKQQCPFGVGRLRISTISTMGS